MKIDIVVQGDVAILSVSGEVDVSNAVDIKASIKDQLTAGLTKIIIDFKEVSYIDSFGIGVLVSGLTTVRKTDGNLKLAALSENVKKIFQLAKLLKFFEIYDTLEGAIKSFEVQI